FYPPFGFVEDRADRQVALEVFERFFDSDELDVILPELCWIIVGEIGAQQIASFTPPYGPQLLAVEGEGERGAVLVDPDIDQAPCGRRLGARGAQLHQELL